MYTFCTSPCFWNALGTQRILNLVGNSIKSGQQLKEILSVLMLLQEAALIKVGGLAKGENMEAWRLGFQHEC